MQITSSTTTRPQFSPAEQSKFAEVKQAFKDLSSALDSGNIDAAKTALATLQKDAPPSANGKSNPISDKLDALSKALDSGDLSSAKSALADIQKDIASRRSGKGGGHHHDGPPPGGAAPAGGAESSGGTSKAKSYDPRDTNQDGTVSAAEELAYELQQAPKPTATSASGDSSKNGFEAYA